jgi:hypothetical protein
MKRTPIGCLLFSWAAAGSAQENKLLCPAHIEAPI